ncbi:MAG: 4-hydroxythreonine-4-phosphate dehydrogenase PdxA [Candidatus Euphemobacter frigidus]|nr:4-hydroxythreonine-4-phosphate dehydrogenase PdxA [Candidatus Euphemobacter frigidus]MDP8276262.1 4-hydroxythreonine-4-phosphate dehydrogenase PdxA [Candidatus Euphemobacter frigidus]
MKIKLAISMGDAAGIGPEVILKAITTSAVKDICFPLIVGAPRVFAPLISSLQLDLPLYLYREPDQVRWAVKGLHILEVEGAPDYLPSPGREDTEWSRTAMISVARGADLVGRGEAEALVTAPINKEGIHRAGYRFQGHTDYLAHLTGTENYAMMLIGGNIRVVLVTVHVPLREVSALLDTEDIVRKIYLARDALLGFDIREPRIAVAGLNPHAGEGGAFGNEEEEIIAPAIEECRSEGIAVDGPIPPDTLFYKLARGRYDAAIVMYHDQGLIPIKMVAFDRGVNITLGLPFVRTSPDHGTAYDIAGRGIANPRSMIEAIKTACSLSLRGRSHS